MSTDEILSQLDALRVFAAVAEHGGFRGAAAALALPRSTVSRRLVELEAALRTRLFHRTTRQVRLTDAGERLLARVQPALAAIADAGRAVIDGHTEPRGLLRITATPSMADRIAPAMLALVARYPEVRVEIELSNRQVDLVGEGFDLALRAGALTDSTLIARALGAGQSGYYASPAYLERRGTPRTRKDLATHDWIVFSGRSRIEDFMVHRRVTVNSLPVVVDAAIAGFGIAWIPEPAVRDTVANGLLVPVLPAHWPPATPLQLVYPSARHLAPQVRAAIDLLLEIVPRVDHGDHAAPVVASPARRKTAAHGNHPAHRRKR